MKAGFKPKLFTKKEWEDNRSPAAKGSGVGKALDTWQAKCHFDMKKMTIKEIEAASAAASALDAALGNALKKCDAKKQKETIAGIGEYKKIVADYKKVLKANDLVLQKRKATIDKLGLNSVINDKEMLVDFLDYAENKAFCYEVMHTYLLWKAKKYVEAVKLYGKANDYNVPGSINEVLLNAFGKGTEPVDKAALAEAIEAMPGKLKQVLDDKMLYTSADSSFKNYVTFLSLLDRRYPIANFSM